MKTDALTITVSGPQGTGKTQIAQKLAFALKKEGIKHTLHDGEDFPQRAGVLIRTIQDDAPGCVDIPVARSFEPLLSDDELEKLLAERPERSVTKEFIESRIFSTSFSKHADTLTICVMKMENDFVVVGKSACAHPANFNEEIGKKIAFEDAFNQVWALEGYLLREALYRERAPKAKATGTVKKKSGNKKAA